MQQKRLLAAAFIFPFFYTHFISHSHSTLWLGFVVLFLCLFLFRAMCMLRTREECVMVTKLVVEMIKKTIQRSSLTCCFYATREPLFFLLCSKPLPRDCFCCFNHYRWLCILLSVRCRSNETALQKRIVIRILNWRLSISIWLPLTTVDVFENWIEAIMCKVS